jgi:hypothetical protein
MAGVGPFGKLAFRMVEHRSSISRLDSSSSPISFKDGEGFMDDPIARLRFLQKGTFTLQGELVTWPAKMREKGRPLFRPVVPLWAEIPSGFVHASHPIHPDDHGFEAMLRSLVEFIAPDEEDALCLSLIQIRDPELATYLRSQLSSTGIQVEVVETLKAIDDAARDMQEFVDEGEPESNLLSTRGMTIERVRAFAESAKVFYLASPWRYLSDTDLVVIDTREQIPFAFDDIRVGSDQRPVEVRTKRGAIKSGDYSMRRALDSLLPDIQGPSGNQERVLPKWISATSFTTSSPSAQQRLPCPIGR